jgi:hypothetical protein
MLLPNIAPEVEPGAGTIKTDEIEFSKSPALEQYKLYF